MVRIDKPEADMIRSLFGVAVHIYRSCKQKSQRHHYYMSEEGFAMNALNDMRKGVSKETLRKKYSKRKIRYTETMY